MESSVIINLTRNHKVFVIKKICKTRFSTYYYEYIFPLPFYDPLPMLFPTIKLRIEERKTFEFEIIVDRNENTSRSDTNTNNFELHI